MASPNFTINGSACPPEKAVAYGATVTLALLSTSGVNTIAWSIVGTDSADTAIPAITPGGSPLGATATLTMVSDPGTGLGASLLVRCLVNGGRDAAGQIDESLSKTALVGVPNTAGIIPFSVGEEFERDSTHGWTPSLNQALAAVGSPGPPGPAGASIPAPALVATSNIALTGVVTVDTVATNALSAGSYVLPVAQTNPVENGPWVVNNSGAWARPTWYDSNAEVAALLGIVLGAAVGGATGVGSVWFQSSGTTTAGAKTWTKLSTPSLVQDSLDVTLPAQDKTQHLGPYIETDFANGRNAIDHNRNDIRTYGANPNGSQQTTVTASGTTGAVVLAAAIAGLKVGQWLMLHQLGAAHGLVTPSAPIVVAQGTTGTRQVEFKFVALTSTHGFTAAGASTSISNAHANIGVQGSDFEWPTYVEAWPAAVANAFKYLAYVRFDGTGNFTYAGGVIAWPLYDADGNAFPQSFRLISATLPTPPEGIPAIAPSTAVPNGLRTKVTAMVSTTSITVSPAPITTGTAKVATLCNKRPLEIAMHAIAYGYGVQSRIPKGSFYITGDLELDAPVILEGGNGGRSQATSEVLCRDGNGVMGCNYTHGLQWQPYTLYRQGDRVVAALRTGILGCWTATAIAGGKTWGLSGSTEPSNYTPGSNSPDNEITWTFGVASAGYLTSADGAQLKNFAIRSAGKTIPAQRSVANNDLRLAPVFLRATTYVAGTTYALNDYVLPTTARQTGKAYKVTQAGTTSGEAAWGRVNGGVTTQGGTAQFTCIDMRQVQGAGLMTMVPVHIHHPQIANFNGTGLFGEGNHYSNGGNIDMSIWSGLDVSGCTGHDSLAQSADGNGVNLKNTTFSPRAAGLVGSCSFQDNSFYGAQLENVISNGGKRFQNQPYNSAQCSSKLDCCYSEGDAPGDADWNLPGKIDQGNIRLRPGATAYRTCFSENPALAFNSPIYEHDVATAGQPIGVQRILVSGFQQLLFGNPLTGGSVQGGTLLQEETGGISADGRSSVKILNRAVTVSQLDHYGARGYCPIYLNGIRMGAGGFTQETIMTSVTAVPTVGLFKAGDVYIWSLDMSRLEIRPGRTGNLGGSARASATPYVRGDIITTGGKAFRNTVPGTSAGTLPAAYAAATIGTQVNDGAVSLWHCWGTAQDPLLYAVPNWSAPPVALADTDYTTTSGLTLAAGPIFTIPAITANRTYDMLATGAITNDGTEFINNNNVAFSVTINDGSGGSPIIILPPYTPCKLRLKRLAAGSWTVDSFQLLTAYPRLSAAPRVVSGTTDTPTAADHGVPVVAANAALTTFTMDSKPVGTVIPFDGTGAGGYTFVNGTATIETALPSNGAAAQHQGRVAWHRTATNVRIS